MRYKSFQYQAASWSQPRRIVAKVEHHQGELFPRSGFIVTNMTLPSRSLVRFYNKRGTAEQWIKEGKQATHWTRLGLATANQELVADELAAPADEDGRTAGQACSLLLAAVGRGAPQPEAVRRNAGADLGATCAGRLAPTARRSGIRWRV